MKVLKLLSHFIYPPICIHCEELANGLFCEACLSLLQPLHPDARCAHCFEELEHQKGLCARCKKSPEFLATVASVFEKEGPAKALALGNSSSAIIKTLASYLAYQYSKLSWDTPDLITFIPLSLPKRLKASYNPSYEIAKKLSQMLGIPLKPLLQEKQVALFQTLLVLRKKASFAHKNVLLVTLDAGKRYRTAYEALLEGFPKKIYHLSFLTGH